MRQFIANNRLLIIVVALGMSGGLLVGIWVGWMAWPVQISNVAVADLSPASQNDYIVLTASDYAFDQDLTRAKARLAQLRDAKIVDRVAALARQYADEGNAAAPQIAALAVALGATDNDIVLIATTATPTPSDTPTPTDTDLPTLTPVGTPTLEPTDTPTRRPTRPRATATPTSMPISATVWTPAYPSGWPDSVNYSPASVPPGQKFWHLVSALYCDQDDKRNNCPNLAGGNKGTSIYVSLLSESGARTSSPLKVVKANGAAAGLADIGPEKSATDMCNCNYAWEADGSSVQVAGAPSDTIGGMALHSVAYQRDRFHVRYYLVFQLDTR